MAIATAIRGVKRSFSRSLWRRISSEFFVLFWAWATLLLRIFDRFG